MVERQHSCSRSCRGSSSHCHCTPKTFESLCLSVTGSSSTVIELLLYRTGHRPFPDAFVTELSSIVPYECHIVLSDDVNIHVEAAHNPHAVHI
ncbi:unnamed protein product [Lampetra planeri]